MNIDPNDLHRIYAQLPEGYEVVRTADLDRMGEAREEERRNLSATIQRWRARAEEAEAKIALAEFNPESGDVPPFPRKEYITRGRAYEAILDALFYDPPMHMKDDDVMRMIDFAMDGQEQFSMGFYDSWDNKPEAAS